mmetsp:Transcript_13562/g.56756  ORF Transcript_13562/g.56756 Transcript_13562/m.56756 type:complete len:418 (-) Transcript_13562:937-2190(-)
MWEMCTRRLFVVPPSTRSGWKGSLPHAARAPPRLYHCAFICAYNILHHRVPRPARAPTSLRCRHKWRPGYRACVGWRGRCFAVHDSQALGHGLAVQQAELCEVEQVKHEAPPHRGLGQLLATLPRENAARFRHVRVREDLVSHREHVPQVHKLELRVVKVGVFAQHREVLSIGDGDIDLVVAVLLAVDFLQRHWLARARVVKLPLVERGRARAAARARPGVHLSSLVALLSRAARPTALAPLLLARANADVLVCGVLDLVLVASLNARSGSLDRCDLVLLPRHEQAPPLTVQLLVKRLSPVPPAVPECALRRFREHLTVEDAQRAELVMSVCATNHFDVHIAAVRSPRPEVVAEKVMRRQEVTLQPVVRAALEHTPWAAPLRAALHLAARVVKVQVVEEHGALIVTCTGVREERLPP